MTYTSTFSCRVGTTNPERRVGLEVWFDHDLIFNQDSLTQSETVTHQFAEDTDQHSIRFVLKNKSADATELDESGNIIADVCARIDQLRFDDIAVDQVFFTHATYQHDFNGTQAPVTAKFYGEMGCVGQVELQFTTPIYLWLLEHM